jgi:hypothetical protein
MTPFERTDGQNGFYELMLANPCTHGPVTCSAEKHKMLANGLPTDTEELRELRQKAMLIDGKCRCCRKPVR